jgi:cytochrome d ubiquinol oxidase subunit II
MDLDALILSRLQFAWVIAWHILLPAFTVGIASFIALLEGLKLVTGREVYIRISTFWIKIFSIAFGMGVVTGVVMPFQIGTNWSRYADATANVLSPLFAYEGLTAFFLEAGFLGVLLFGRKLVPPWAYFVSALMVALGTLFSSFWILAANSWMQTPAGYEIVNGQFFPTDWFAVIFSLSFPYRLAHVVVGFFVTTGFVVLGVGAYLVRRQPTGEEGRTMLSMTLWPVFRVPDHGRMRRLDAWTCVAGRLVALARTALRRGVVPSARTVRRAARVRSRDRRVVRHRGWTSALDRLRAVSHGAIGVAFADELRRRDFTRGLHARVSADLSVGPFVDAPRRPQGVWTSHGTDSEDRSRTAASPAFGRSAEPRQGRDQMSQVLDFVPLWTLILGMAVFFYVLFDGFDLGVGMLFGLAPDAASRNTIMNTIAPVWDGNETWLVFGGLALLAAFPLAFAIIIPAVYFPILVMLLALVFRGVAFEFRFRDAESKTFWDHAFYLGSAIATFAQGMVLGAFIQGFRVSGRQFAGTSFDFLSPFALLTGVALLFGYGLLGAGWLILKTEGAVQAAARRQGRICLIGVLLGIGIVSIWTPLMSETVAARWFSWPNILLLAPVPLATAAVAWLTWRALGSKAEAAPFLGAMGLFVLSYLGIAISLYPMIVPPHFTLWQAASSDRTQAFLLVGTLMLLPVILMYTGWSYWVFRGKVRSEIGYE